ncbi:MAG: very short patch repair endonuclease [Deltaproteobacteria bacterium]|nr:very short patch repair endonuclease [Deltaproteobacteria bacterium]
MTDTHSPEVRSYNMSRIRSSNTKPEEIVRKYLFSRGLRYRKNDKRYPGKPDMVFPKYRTAVFVNGCFWHCHEGCSDFVMPKSRVEYWQHKLERNRQRDRKNTAALETDGWRVLTIWECELKKAVREGRLEKLYRQIIISGADIHNEIH